MFSLIITTVAILITVVLAIAGIYYGGEAFSRSDESARIAKDLNEIEQLRAAAVLYHQDKGKKAENVQELIDNKYLTGAMSRDWFFGSGYGFSNNEADVDDEYCLAFNKRALGLEYIPECSDPRWSTTLVCCNPS